MSTRTINLIGAVLGFITLGLAVYWYDWKLALLIFLALFSNNLERKGKEGISDIVKAIRKK